MKEIQSYSLLPALNRTATATGTGVDLQPTINIMGRNMKAILNVGAVVSSASPEDATLDVTIEESDALGSGYAAISGAAFTQVTSAIGAVHEEIHFIQTKRYIRAVGTQAGTGDEVDYCVLVAGVLRLSQA